MGYVQTRKPELQRDGKRGWCLAWVDDEIDAHDRTATAAIALNNERRAGRIKLTVPPKNVWVIGFLDMRTGAYAGYDHVFLMKYLGDGRYDIRDSEWASKARGIYHNIAEIKAWFGAYKPVYAGWSTSCDGRTIAKSTKKSNTTIAKEVIAQKWGNGPDRVARLKKAGYDPAAIQKIVNSLL